jgi:N-terminal acetyltransferase B complex non-catalytic subunit
MSVLLLLPETRQALENVLILSIKNSLPDSAVDKKLFGQLAYRMISKSRTDTPTDTTVVPPRAIQTSQEVGLYLEVLPYVAPDSATATKEALELLSSSNLGVDSKIGSGDWWGLVRRQLDLLEESGNWMEVWKACESLLHGVEVKAKESAAAKTDGEAVANEVAKKTDGAAVPETEGETKGRGDDWRVWEGFVKAAGELYNQENKDQGNKALEVILQHRETAKTGTSRNADLALVKFASLFHDHHEGPEGTPTLLEACKEYFTRTGTKSCCFEDLQNYLEMLEMSEKKEFLGFVEKHIEDMDADDEVLERNLQILSYQSLTDGFYQKSKISKTAAQINHHKFIYLLTISPLTITATSTSSEEEVIPKLNDFITSSLKIYVGALPLGSALLDTDNQYGDDAALLSIMGLVRLHLLHSSITSSSTSITAQAPLYQALIILEAVVSKSKHNYQALLLLVRLYLLLGAASLAVEVYPRLNIKQIQNDTLSHFLLTRISTILPAEKKVEAILNDAGRIYESSSSQTPNMLVLAFERGGYAQMMGFIEFSERVAGSVCRSMWEIERRRLDRLGPQQTNKIDDLETLDTVLKDDAVVWDNRDFGVLVNCETEHPPSIPAAEEGGEATKVQKKRFEELFRTSAPPGENWVKAFAVVEKLVVYCKAVITVTHDLPAPGPLSLQPENGTSILEKIQADPEATIEFTGPEREYIEFAHLLTAMIQAAIAKDGVTVISSAEKAQSWLSSRTPSPDSVPSGEPDWNTLHAMHLYIDAAILVGAFVAPTLQSPLHKQLHKSIRPAITSLIAAATAFHNALLAAASKVSKAIAEEDGSDKEQELVDRVLELEQGNVGRALRDMPIFGGVEKVVEGVRRIRRDVARAVDGGRKK